MIQDLIPRASRLGSTPSLVPRCLTLVLAMQLGQLDEAKIRAVAADDAQEIAAIQKGLDEGNLAVARERFRQLNVAVRGFEYSYLEARLAAAPENGPAPDLIQSVAAPPVDTRYGVLAPIGRQVVFICRDGSLRVHELARPKEAARTISYAEGGAVWSGAFSRNGEVFVAGYGSGAFVVWDTKTWEKIHTVDLGDDWPVRELAVAPDGKAVVAESKKALELWSLADDQPVKIADVGERYNFGEGLAFSPRGDLIATGGMFDVLLQDAKTGQPTQQFRHASYTMGLAFSPDGNQIASAPRGNVNKFLAIFDIAQSKQVFSVGPLQHYVVGMAFSPDSKRLAATGPQRDIRLFDSTTGHLVWTLQRSERTANPAFTNDGRVLGWSQPGSFHYIEIPAPSAL